MLPLFRADINLNSFIAFFINKRNARVIVLNPLSHMSLWFVEFSCANTSQSGLKISGFESAACRMNG